MSADLSDPQIQAVWQEIRNADSPVDWLLLGYAPEGPKDKLALSGRGEAGLDGLQAFLAQRQVSAIYFGLLRVEGRFLLVTILPEDAGGVKRARALVHSRAVGAKFQHQASITVARANDLTGPAVRSKLRLDTGSAKSSVPSSPNLQLGSPTQSHQLPPGPSPLRSTFPHASSPPQIQGPYGQEQRYGESSPPPIPAKEGTNLARAGTNSSTRSAAAASPRLGGSPSHTFVNGAHNSPHLGMQPSQYGNGTDNARSGLGLGLPVSVAYAGDHRQHASTSVLDTSRTQQEPYTRSPRLASLGASPTLQQGSQLPNRSTTPTTHVDSADEPTSPPVPPKKASVEARDFAQDPQSLPLPAAEGDTAPNSARTLEDSTLASMWEPSGGDTSVGSADSEEPNEVRTNGKRESTLSERQAIAERLARETEERWHREQEEQRRAEQAAQEAREAAAQAEREEAVRVEQEAAAVAERERLQREADERAAAQEAERVRQLEEAEAERLRQEEEAEAERARIADAEEAEAQRIAEEEEAERFRLAEEERLRQEERERQEAEAKRLKEEAEQRERDRLAELERQRQEAEQAKIQAREDLKLRLQQGEDTQPALTGFVSVQGGSSILWRRRYFEMTPTTLHLYKSDKDVSHAVDSIGLKGRWKSLESTAEELMAIPHSFKLVPQDYDDEPVLFYCDDEDDKELLVSGLRVAAQVQ